jgi:ketosteroid isomerase-like protein
MIETNKAILEKANAAITQGDHEGFLAHCTEDTHWEFVGERILSGKDTVRQWMTIAYAEPPQFVIDHFIAEGDFVTAMGRISLQDETGETASYSYCDVWRFRDGKMAELKAFVIRA